MCDLNEIMFVTTSNDSQLACSAWDFRTGTNFINYKVSGNCNIQQNSFNYLRSQYVLAADSMKPLLYVWPMNSQEQLTSIRFVLPGKANAVAVCPDYTYLVVGIQETLYVWNLVTGRMLNSIAKHYQPITCIRFTDDGSHFVSAGRDGNILVWNLTTVVSEGDDNNKPLYSFTDHGLPVLDFYVGVGGIKTYLYSASEDRTCRIYDLWSGTLLLTVVFGEGLRSLTVNALETNVFVGTLEGNIYEFSIDSAPRTKEYHIEKNHSNKFEGHTANESINCLVVAADGHTLVSGGQNSEVCVWDINSRQLLKKLKFKGSITNLYMQLANTNMFNAQHIQPQMFYGNLKRMMDPPEADEDEVIPVLVTKPFTVSDWSMLGESGTPFFDDWEGSIKNTEKNGCTTEEIETLQAEVARLKQINKQLFDTSVKQLLKHKNK